MVIETKTQSIFANVLYMTKIAFNHINGIRGIAVDVLSDRNICLLAVLMNLSVD